MPPAGPVGSDRPTSRQSVESLGIRVPAITAVPVDIVILMNNDVDLLTRRDSHAGVDVGRILGVHSREVRSLPHGKVDVLVPEGVVGAVRPSHVAVTARPNLQAAPVSPCAGHDVRLSTSASIVNGTPTNFAAVTESAFHRDRRLAPYAARLCPGVAPTLAG